MLSHLHILTNNESLAIPDKSDELILSLKAAFAKEYSLGMEQSSYADCLDAIRLACRIRKLNSGYRGSII
jgi:hypothetical protein